MTYKTTVNKNFNGDFSIIIKHHIANGYELQSPIVEDGVKWETDAQGSPGKLTFKLYKDKNNNLSFQEGDMVALKYQDSAAGLIELFNGYIFTKKRSKDGWIEVTAYDQLRYFKNKGTYVYTNKKASDVLKMLASDYKLSLGTIDDTSYVIGSRTEDDQSLLDIMQNALDLTLISSNKRYVLYSHNNKLYLRDAEKLKTDVVINDVVAENFDYTSTIDNEVYNDIELYYDDDKANKRTYYHKEDANNILKWGRLRYTESIQNPANAQDRADKMLKLYNRKNRTIKVTKAFGNYQCRAGASVVVNLNLGDMTVNNYMFIDKATHTFNKNEYRMDLTLSDKEFTA